MANYSITIVSLGLAGLLLVIQLHGQSLKSIDCGPERRSTESRKAQ